MGRRGKPGHVDPGLGDELAEAWRQADERGHRMSHSNYEVWLNNKRCLLIVGSHSKWRHGCALTWVAPDRRVIKLVFVSQ